MSRFKASEGDWVCSKEDCQNVNFAKRQSCNKCGEAKGTSHIVKKSGSEIGSNFADKSKGLFSADDWQCSKCGNINWARRTTCNVCNAPKVCPDEVRTGYGGGFKENENILYDRNDDSDGEFDEYGRKKKKYRGTKASVSDEEKDKVERKEEGGSEEKKGEYSDEDEDDEDDDEDGDLSKYNLDSDDDDDDGPPPEPKILGKRASRTSEDNQQQQQQQRRDRSRSPVWRN